MIALINSKDLPVSPDVIDDDYSDILIRQKAFGYTFEDIRFLLGPSAQTGKQPLDPWATTPPWQYFPRNLK